MREHGLPAGSASAWLASVLRDGFAASLVGLPIGFGPLGAAALRDIAASVHDPASLDATAVDAMLEQLPTAVGALPAHDDVEPGIRRMIDAGLGVSTLTNGASRVAQGLLERLGLAGEGIGTLSVDGTRARGSRTRSRTWAPATAWARCPSRPPSSRVTRGTSSVRNARASWACGSRAAASGRRATPSPTARSPRSQSSSTSSERSRSLLRSRGAAQRACHSRSRRAKRSRVVHSPLNQSPSRIVPSWRSSRRRMSASTAVLRTSPCITTRCAPSSMS